MASPAPPRGAHARRLGVGVAALGFAALGVPPLAWHQGVVAGIGGLLGLILPLPAARVAMALGTAAAASSADRRVGLAAALGALTLLAVRAPAAPGDEVAVARDAAVRRSLRAAAALAVGVGLVLAVKQEIAARVLPAAAGVAGAPLALALSVAAGLVAAAAPAWPEVARPREGARGVSVHGGGDSPGVFARLSEVLTGPRPLAVAGLLVGVATGAKLLRLRSFPPPQKLAAAVELDAVPLVYADVFAAASAPKDEATLAALVRAAPGRDEAALALGWERALVLGWRPDRAEGVVVPVARALELAGRGGEALRLLARHPRTGEVDGLRALFERTQGVAVGWKGGALGTSVPAGATTELLAAPVAFTHDDAWLAEVTAPAALDVTMALTVDCEGTEFEGPPVLEVAWDGRPAERVECPARGWGSALDLAAGPHRLRVAFVNDASGPAGDRNVTLTRVAIVPAEAVFGGGG